MTLTKQEIADLKELLANTHTTERSGKYDAYKVAAYMRDKGRDVISKIIERHEAVESSSDASHQKVLLGYVGDLGNGARLFGRAFYTIDQGSSKMTIDEIEETERKLSKVEGKTIIITSVSYL